VVAEENEQLVFLDSKRLDSGSELTARVIGPRNTKTSPVSDTCCEVRVQVDSIGAQTCDSHRRLAFEI